MKSFRYLSGDEVQTGDQIAYHGEAGKVELVAAAPVGDPVLDWYLEEFPGGGVMISATGFGNVFLTAEDLDEHLTFLARAKQSGQ